MIAITKGGYGREESGFLTSYGYLTTQRGTIKSKSGEGNTIIPKD